MAMNPTSPITGGAQTGFSSPTYTFVSDVSPILGARLFAVTALGGTQAGVRTHSATDPFTLEVRRPAVYKMLGTPNPTTGVIANIPKNTLHLLTKKGVLPAASQSPSTLTLDTAIVIPAGSDTYDAANIRAAISAHIGMLQQISAGIGDTAVTGIL